MNNNNAPTRMEDTKIAQQPTSSQLRPVKTFQEEFKTNAQIPTQLTKDLLNIVKKGNLNEIVNFVSKFYLITFV